MYMSKKMSNIYVRLKFDVMVGEIIQKVWVASPWVSDKGRGW